MDELRTYKEMVKELIKQQEIHQKKIDYLDKLVFNAFRKCYPELYLNMDVNKPDEFAEMQEKYLEFLTELSKMGDAKRFPD